MSEEESETEKESYQDDINQDEKGTLLSSTDTELDIAINEELIKKSQDEIKKKILSLQNLIYGLKEQLRNEKELWKQEIEQVIATQNHYMTHALCYANSYFHSEWDDSSDYDVLLNNRKRICFISKSDEDLKLVKYHSGLRTRRLNIANFDRNIAIENYKKKLSEVESMCNMELNRVKNSVQSLQTLQQVAAEWDQASGDSFRKIYHKDNQLPENLNKLKNTDDLGHSSENQE